MTNCMTVVVALLRTICSVLLQIHGINDIVSCLDPQKASEPDDISHRMLIVTTNTICRPLC
jgi:hypothetical protein